MDLLICLDSLVLGSLNPNIIHTDGLCKVATVLLHYLSADEMTQVNGVTFLMDCTSVNNKITLKFLKPDFAKWNKMWQVDTLLLCLPLLGHWF